MMDMIWSRTNAKIFADRTMCVCVCDVSSPWLHSRCMASIWGFFSWSTTVILQLLVTYATWKVDGATATPISLGLPRPHKSPPYFGSGELRYIYFPGICFMINLPGSNLKPNIAGWKMDPLIESSMYFFLNWNWGIFPASLLVYQRLNLFWLKGPTLRFHILFDIWKMIGKTFRFFFPWRNGPCKKKQNIWTLMTGAIGPFGGAGTLGFPRWEPEFCIHLNDWFHLKRRVSQHQTTRNEWWILKKKTGTSQNFGIHHFCTANRDVWVSLHLSPRLPRKILGGGWGLRDFASTTGCPTKTSHGGGCVGKLGVEHPLFCWHIVRDEWWDKWAMVDHFPY